MEAVSLAASIAGLVTLADLVFRAAVKYSKSVRDAPKEVRDLVDEIKDLSLLLHNLSMVEYGLASQPDPTFQANSQPPKPHHLHQCQQLLRRLQTGLPNIEASSGLQKLQKRLKWPFSISDTKDMLQAIGRHKQTINIALAAQSINKLQICLSRQEESSNAIQDIKENLRRILDIETKISVDKKRRKILTTFLHVNPRVEFETNKSLRHPMTALWLTEGTDFTDLFNNEKSRLWCSGIPGARKSVIASAIVDECLQLIQNQPNTALGYFFCTYKDPRTVLPCNILSTLCYQLALQHEAAYQILEAYYDELHPSPHLPMPLKTSRLIEVLHKICGVFDRVYLIIDGLDECGGHTDEAVRSMLRISSAPANENINVALLSRNEFVIRERLEPHFQWIEIEAHTHDIQLYVASELAIMIEERRLRLRDPCLKDEIVVKLVKGAKGMFRWVTCQLYHLCELPTDRARREALDKLPPTLFETYERILNHIESRSQAVRQLVQRSLLLISMKDPHKRLSSRALCEAISISEDSDSLELDEVVDEEEVLRRCGSLVRLSKSSGQDEQTFQFAHFTVQEFLESSCEEHSLLTTYGVSDTRADILFMQLAIRFLTLENFAKISTVEDDELRDWNSRLKSRPFYIPAATCWTVGALLEVDKKTQSLLSQLFHIQKTSNFCVWAGEVIRNCQNYELDIEVGPEAMECLSSVLRPDFTPLHMAAALGLADICQQLLENGAKIDLMGPYGTPLHSAVGGFYIFRESYDYPGAGSKTPNSTSGGCCSIQVGSLCNWTRSQEQQKTVRLLLNFKAKADRRLATAWRTSTVLTLAVFEAYSYEIIADLIENGAIVENEDLATFQVMYEFAMAEFTPPDFKREYGQGNAFLRILNGLRSVQSYGKHISPEGQLFNMTLRFASNMVLDVPDELSMSSIREEMLDQHLRDSVLLAIERNDINLLETFLLSQRCQGMDLSGLDTENSDWSPIHIAVQEESLDCLEFLLDWGCDPNTRAADDKTPIDLCMDKENKDIFRTLLKHGASTTELDGKSDTLWHSYLDSYTTWPIQTLLQLESSQNRALALCTVSGRGDTPICRALIGQHKESVLLLLDFCDTEAHWKCSKPIYRAAAELGSFRVLNGLLDVGVHYDSHDEYDGNPLHWIHVDSDLNLIMRLKVIFSSNQRRTSDSATPFQSLLQRAKKLGLDKKLPHAMELLPDNLFTNPAESRALWLFLCAEIVPFILSSNYSKTDMMVVCTTLLERGVTNLYEEDSKTSALVPLTDTLKSKLNARIQSISDGGLPTPFGECWKWVSDTICLLLRRTKYKIELAYEDSLVHLLSMAILRDDGPMVGLLLRAGANCLAKGSSITPLELACLPSVSVTRPTLSCLLEHTDLKPLTQHLSYPDLGPLHLIAGVIRREGAYNNNGTRSLHKVPFGCYADKDKDESNMTTSLDKFDVLLGAGANPNLPLNALSPMTYHILRHHFRTAEALLDRGADPWAHGSFSLDSVLAAILCRNIAFVAKVARQSAQDSHQPQWSRTYTIALYHVDLYRKMHALHVAASLGYLEALEFYFDRHLLSSLDVKDEDQQTPMHYAASNGYISIIDYLVAHGCDINAASSSGLTPLHLAVQKRKIGAVHSLLNHGATQKPCFAGWSPIIHAYNTGDQHLISLLRTHSNQLADNQSMITGRSLNNMREALSLAISHNDLEACRMVYQLGCPLDVEIRPSVTPLVFSINHGCSASLVEWLLNRNVRSSILTWHERLGRLLTPLHLVLMNPAYHSILDAVAIKHVQEGDLASMYHWNPLTIAVEYSNTAGLMLLLETLKTHCSVEDLSSLVKQTRDTYSQYGPIVACARYNNLEALTYLFNFEGNIDCCGDLSLQVFQEATIWDRHQIVKYLISRCARPVESPSFAANPFLSACFEDSFSVVQLLLDTCTMSDTLDCFGNNAINLLADSTNSNPITPNLAVLMSLVDHGIDPFTNNDLGINACHHMLAHDSSTYLRYILARFPRCFSNQNFAWPPAWAWSPPKLGLKRLGNISRNLKLVRPFVNASEFRLLTDLPSSEGHTMLCQALLQERSEVFDNFIKLGVDIERPCKKHGTPLVVALSTGHLSAVKCLVRSGAKLSLSELLHSGTFHALTNSTVKDWVLVGRHYEQAKLAANAWDRDRVRTKGAGVVPALIRMEWHWRKGCGETILGYASRHQRLIRDLRGTQVKVIRLYG